MTLPCGIPLVTWWDLDSAPLTITFCSLLLLFLFLLSAQGVVALKNDALFPELHLLDTLHCPIIIAVFEGPY